MLRSNCCEDQSSDAELAHLEAIHALKIFWATGICAGMTMFSEGNRVLASMPTQGVRVGQLLHIPSDTEQVFLKANQRAQAASEKTTNRKTQLKMDKIQ